MKTIKFLLIISVLFSMSIPCSSQTADNNKEASKAIKVFYFHFTKRCMTCQAVEKVTNEAISEYYGNEVSFAEYNLDKPGGEEKGKELNVSGQTLLIVKDDQKINLTNEGFLYARSNPDKLKEIIKERIDKLL